MEQQTANQAGTVNGEQSSGEKNNGETRTARIVVALDTSRQSLAALEEAAFLAALMQAELESLFVEDINLLHLCGFPFCNQIGSYTATPRRVDNRAMERQLRGLANRLRAETARIAQQARVPWQFRVRRGAVAAELLEAAESALFLSLGRAGVSRRKPLGSIAQAVMTQATRPILMLGEGQKSEPPLIVVYTGDAASRRGLELALRLAPRFAHKLYVWVQPSAEDNALHAAALQEDVRSLLAQNQADYARTHEQSLQAEIVPIATPGALSARLQGVDADLAQKMSQRTVILPNSLAHLVAHHAGPTILVP